MENIGEQVFNLRKKLRLSQKEFGERIGITPQQVSNIEKDGTTKRSTLVKIESEFGISFAKGLQNENNSDSFWKSIVEEYKEREKHYRETISSLTAQLGKFTGNTDAIVAGFKVIRLQSGLHRLRHAA